MKAILRISVLVSLVSTNLFCQYTITPEQKKKIKIEVEKLCEWVIDGNGDKVLRYAVKTDKFKSTGSLDYGCVDRKTVEVETEFIETLKCIDRVKKTVPSGYKVISTFCPDNEKYEKIISSDEKIYKVYDLNGKLESYYDCNTHLTEGLLSTNRWKGKFKENKVAFTTNVWGFSVPSITRIGRWIERKDLLGNEYETNYYYDGKNIEKEYDFDKIVELNIEKEFTTEIESYRDKYLTSKETDDYLLYFKKRLNSVKQDKRKELEETKQNEVEESRMQKFLDDSLSDFVKINSFINNWFFKSRFDEVIRFSNKVTNKEFWETYTIPVVNQMGGQNNYFYYFELQCKGLAYVGQNDVNSFNEVYKIYESWTKDGKLTEVLILEDYKFYVKNGAKFPEQSKKIINEIKEIRGNKRLDSMLK